MIEHAASTDFSRGQISLLRRSKRAMGGWLDAVERLLEAERAQLPLWAPIALGAGICAWFALPTPQHWIAWIIAWLGLALGFGILAQGGRLGHVLAVGSVLVAGGCLLVWGKAMLVGAPPLARAAVVEMEARVRAVEPLAARALVRLDLAPIDRPDLPARVRVTLPPEQFPKDINEGDRIAVRARLMPPAPPALPGAYDFSERAYFDGIGASGRALGPIRRVGASGGGPGLRTRLGAHVARQLPGPEGAIAVTLATGDQTGISAADAEAMRRSGLAHLLSISGLHVSALIGGVIFLVYRLLALSTRLALHWPIILIAACVGAAAGIGYTLLTGAQVPTVRSCIAALLVIAGLALGREAISLRLIATGALFVMAFWPDAVVGPSFQMSFLAVTAIVALYEYPPARALFEAREEGRLRGLARHGLALFATGLLVELVLAPIAFAHFHRAGMLGALANMIAIPLTSFVVMPGEVVALLLDSVGLGAPAWWVVGAALRLLLGVAHLVSAQPYATTAVPVTSNLVFVATMLGILWMMLWRGPLRWIGAPVAAIGLTLTLLAPSADLLVTADGRHVALRMADGRMALLRERAGDYMRTTLAEVAAYDGEFASLPDTDLARCSRDLCEADLPVTGAAPLHLLVTRSTLIVPWEQMIAACTRADIVIADRMLPRACTPRWLKLDRPTLGAMGGAMLTLKTRQMIGGHDPRDRHPWVNPGRDVVRGMGRRVNEPIADHKPTVTPGLTRGRPASDK